MWWTVPKIWNNGTCYIIGGGPSVIKQFDIPQHIVDKVHKGESSPIEYSPYLESLHGEHVIAVNMAYRLGDWIDFIFYGDTKYGDAHRVFFQQHPATTVTCANKNEKSIHQEIKYLARNPAKIYGITTNPSQVSWNNNSGSAAINFAVHTGVKRIVLFGFDMSLDVANNQHWHKFYAGNPKTVQGTIKKHLQGFPQMVKDLQQLGIEVLNCSPESKIEGFKKVTLKDLHL